MTVEVVYALMAELIIETVVTEVYKLKGLEKSNKTLCISLLVEKNILNGKFYNNSK
jgi:tRNA A37 threonylcarbamoyladenosine synthetase subunit TsaC/SUA5/YrdC